MDFQLVQGKSNENTQIAKVSL